MNETPFIRAADTTVPPAPMLTVGALDTAGASLLFDLLGFIGATLEAALRVTRLHGASGPASTVAQAAPSCLPFDAEACQWSRSACIGRIRARHSQLQWLAALGRAHGGGEYDVGG
ncbi:hypothetical protein [Thauera linaloolentis]|uniref:hypothetical protein n=1 Tax=Thauera linaloolentis TaxID=76112 RepID=UPI0012B5DDFD|nr:hypothetical protein [Thauera linaloolentis]MCM8565001.1 hypothetical protein [Thauera linaloolentis]